MIHTAWTARDGAPQNINTMAQTSDGTLWLGTRDGLYSFDGIHFTLFRPVSGELTRGNVQHLQATKDGFLWAFGPRLLPTRIRDGVVTPFGRVANGSAATIDNIQQAADGAMWGILSEKDLVRLGPDGIWRTAAKPKSDQLGGLLIDSSDTQWVVADGVVYRRSKDQTAFTPTVKFWSVPRLEEAPDHSIWIASSDLIHIDPLGKPLPHPMVQSVDVSDVIGTHDGSIWISHTGGGIQRLRLSEIAGQPIKSDGLSPDLFTASEGLTTTGFRVLLSDRDGNVWVAGGRGIDRFQPAVMEAAIPAAINGEWSVCATPGGDVWLSIADGFLGVIRNGKLIRLPERKEIGSLLCNKAGNVYLRTLDAGIAEIRNDRFVSLPTLPERGEYFIHYRFTSFIRAANGAIVASTNGPTTNGLWEYQGNVWKPFLPSSGISGIRAMAANADGDLYLGSGDGKIIVLRGGTFDVLYSASPGVGVIDGFSETSYGMFGFGEHGLALQRGGTFRMLSFANPDLAAWVTGLAEDGSGDIWINGSRAIARVTASEMQAAIADSTHRIQGREFREGEFAGSDIFAVMRNSAQVDKEGRIWFPTANGVVSLDPRHVNRPTRPPIASIRSISADGKPLKADRTFSPGVLTMDIRYFGLNLSNPSGVVYRYRLDGADAGWQEVGTRSEAIYTHPRPGTYVFHVQASNGGETWSASADSQAFTILPTFYQTWWFDTLCVAVGVLLLWLVMAARTRYVTAAVRIRAEERASERVRIARELHDTLLQGVQGLLLCFHAAAEKVPNSHEAKEALEKALTTAERIILEARDRVNRLRSESLLPSELEPSLEAVAIELSSLSTIDFSMESTGERKELKPDLMDEVFYIAREALTNAFRHSSATRIALKLEYGPKQFVMECRDDGRGFDGMQRRQAEANGHWGLQGMQERARKIGGEIRYDSAPGNGTRIQLTLPAGRAYGRSMIIRKILGRDA